ncbi:MAG: hypothetical protein ACYTFY_22315 [Planctomycetota bacterium]|jgi:hypothetical protein
MPTLQGMFKNMPKRELENMLWRFREHDKLKNSPLLNVLTWKVPGTVWAMDYMKPPSAIEAIYKDILVVRDLASGNEIEALPVPVENGLNTRDGLKSLFVQHGAPLVIKHDNGPPLIAWIVQELLREWSVFSLRSPAYTPQYNGSCEAGNGSIKTRTHHIASKNGRPGNWTCDDLEEARILTNQTARAGNKQLNKSEIFLLSFHFAFLLLVSGLKNKMLSYLFSLHLFQAN